MAMRGIASHGRRRPKALGSRLRSRGRTGKGRPCGVGRPCRCPTSPAAPVLPSGSPARSLWVITKDLWYYLRLSVEADNDRAQAFYQRIGLAWSRGERIYQVRGDDFAALAQDAAGLA